MKRTSNPQWRLKPDRENLTQVAWNRHQRRLARKQIAVPVLIQPKEFWTRIQTEPQQLARDMFDVNQTLIRYNQNLFIENKRLVREVERLEAAA